MGSYPNVVVATIKSKLHVQTNNILFLPSLILSSTIDFLNNYLHSSLRLTTVHFTAIPLLSMLTSHTIVH